MAPDQAQRGVGRLVSGKGRNAFAGHTYRTHVLYWAHALAGRLGQLGVFPRPVRWRREAGALVHARPRRDDRPDPQRKLARREARVT